MSNQWNQNTYISAYLYAAKAHNCKKLEGTRLPYLVHVSLVSMEIAAALATEKGHDGDLVIQCALLHDIIEDTRIRYDELRTIFSKQVADGVLALSKNPKIDKEKQMRDCLRRIEKQPPEIGMVKLADRITNLRTPPKNWSKEKINDYRKEAKLIHRALKDCSPFLAARLMEKIKSYPG